MGGGAKGVDRPDVEDSVVGQKFVDLLGKADTRTQQLFDMIQPLLGTAQGQASDIISGEAGPFIPAIQSAVASGQGNLAQSMAQTQEQMNRMGITGTDFARLSADQLRQGGQQIAGIPSQFTQPILNAIFQSLTGTQGQAVASQGQGLAAAGGVTQSAIQPITGRTTAQEVAGVLQGIGSIVGGLRAGS